MQDIRDLTKTIDSAIVKKIFGNKENAIGYLRKIEGNENNVKNFKSSKPEEIYSQIVKIWDYNLSLEVIRELFKSTKKYQNGKNGGDAIKVLLAEWQKLELGKVAWPFSQGQFDAFVQSINSENTERTIKDDKVKLAAVQYRRIKEINTVRNDFLETLIFEKNPNIIPTLSHSRGVDFFINGISFDQKVAKSPTNEFKKDFGEKWKGEAINNPIKVAEYLYRLQDEGRFGAEPRLFVVYLDEDITPSQVEHIITNTNLQRPLEVTFDFKHDKTGKQTYKTFCFVILLHNTKEEK